MAALETDKPPELKIRRSPLRPRKKTDLPALGVFFVGEARTDYEDANTPMLQHTQPVGLFIYVEVDEDEDPDAALDPYIGHADKQLLDDVTLGDQVINTRRVSCETDLVELDAVYATAILMYEIVYFSDQRDPEAVV